ncbi:hypothetical protein BGZ98_009992 [Dissophora globulifera]|nr:hypothetical protein BGZ98_009992 [Dissophora globulifera]
MITVLKLASTLVVLMCFTQAAPARRLCADNRCSEVVNSDDVLLGSTTSIVPAMQTMPIAQYWPFANAFMPTVETFNSGYDRWLERFPCNVDHRVQHPGSRLPPTTTIIPNNNNIITPVIKRHMAPECVPSATVSCEQNLASSTTDMGSAVIAMPENVVLPSTVYQGHVQSKEAQVYAAEAQHTNLKQSNINLGSNVLIQPVTKVIPQTTYQPSVDQKATVVEMAAPENESLARSSVTLGSTVTVRPVTTIEPLTIYQPKVVSLPFIIHDETGCEMHVIPKAKECESFYC